MENQPLTVDSVVGNVTDLTDALAQIEALTGLKPFFRFELEIMERCIPIALVQCGAFTLEFLERVEGSCPTSASRITRVVLEVPGIQAVERELAPGLMLAAQPGPKPRIRAIEAASSAIPADVAVLKNGCGAEIESADADSTRLRLGDVALILSAQGGTLTPAAYNSFMPGWQRIALAGTPLETAVTVLTPQAEMKLPPSQVLPGLREAMFRLPSGLVIQPVEQQLWKMLPVMGTKWAVARLTGRSLRFKEQVG